MVSPGSQRRYGLKTLLISLACLAGAGASTYFLYKDFNSSGGAGLGKPMATVEKRDAKVRRKSASSYLWTHVLDAEDLYRKDSIQTGPGSAVSVRLADGTLLELGEDSLIVIDEIQNLQLNFARGQIVVRGKKGDQKITVDKDGKAKVEEIPVRLLRPESLAHYYVPENSEKELRFVWEPKDRAPDSEAKPPEKYVIQVSPERTFRSKGVLSFATESGDAHEISAKIPAGRWFWRVTDPKGAPLTQGSQFRVSAAYALRPVWPSPAEKVVNWGDDSAVQFRWSAPKEQEEASAQVRHELEIARDSDFKELVAHEAVAAGASNATLRNIPGGKLYWRIRSQYPEVPVVSPVLEFRVEKAQKLAVNLGKPEEGSAFEFQPQYRFNWNCDAEEVEYEWELQAGEKTVATHRGSATAFIWKAPDAGTYRWRVQAFSKGRNVGESTWRRFSIFKGKPIALKVPAPEQQILYWEQPEKFSFEWDRQDLAEEGDYAYQLELSNDREFRGKVLTERTKDLSVSSKKLNLAAGTWYWRVKLVDGGGQSLKTSESRKVIYGVHPVLRAPASVEPEAGKVYEILEKDVSPVLKWAPVDGADSYEVTVKLEGKVVFQGVAEKPTIELKGLKDGKYSWNLRTVDKLKRRGEPSDVHVFSITYGDLLAPPEATSPEVQ